MKLETLFAAEGMLQELAALKLTDAQTAWDLAEALEVATKHLQRFHEKRNELIKEHGKESPEEPGRFEVQDPETFNKKIQKILEVEVVIDFPKLDLSQLNGSEISAGEILSMKTLGIIKNKKDDSTKEEKPRKG